MTVVLTGLATASPPRRLGQREVEEIARRRFADTGADFERLSGAFASAGIDERGTVAPEGWFLRDHGWPGRNAAYLEGARPLFVEAARGALAEAGREPREVDAVVTVSSTGVATPSLEAQVWGEIGFRDDVRRAPLFGLGCAGGVTGLSAARDLAAARPGAVVVMVAVETCTLAFRPDRARKADVIAAALFGDGAAAACVELIGPDGRARATLRATLCEGSEKIWPDTLDVMGWEVDEAGLGVVFDRSIPAFARAELRGATEAALARSGIGRGEVARYVLHPGGTKVLEAVEDALALGDGALDIERGVLRDCGNMSSPTVLFVLERALERGARGALMLAALGPGFTASFLPLSIRDRG